MSNDLASLTDQPEITVTIAGEPYGFSELPLSHQGQLQAWIKAHVPHPIAALKGGVLDGLPAHVAEAMGNAARLEAASWPPEVGTAAGASALLGSEAGQLEALRVGLSVHQPGTAAADVRRLYKALRADAGRAARKAKAAGQSYDGEGDVRRIFAVMFGLDDPDVDGPKA